MSNIKPFFDDLMKDVREFGREQAAGLDAMPKMALRVAKAADEGVITLDKDPDGKDDVHRIYDEFITARSKKAVYEHTETGKKANASKLRAIVKMILEAGAKYDGMQTLTEAIEVRNEKFAADRKSVKPAYHALVDVAREQIKLDRQMSRDELAEVVAKAPPADPELEKVLERIRKSLEKVITGEAGVKTDDDRILQAHDLVKETIAAMISQREDEELQRRLAERGLKLVSVVTPEPEVIEAMAEAAE